MGGVVVVTFDENEEEKAIFRAYTLRACGRMGTLRKEHRPVCRH